MNKKLFDIVEKSDKNRKTLEACRKKSCKTEVLDNIKQINDIAVEMKALLADKTLTTDEFIAKSNKMRADMAKSKITRDMLECSIKNCDKDVRELLAVAKEFIEYDCKREKKKASCDNLKVILEILKRVKKKEITVDNYQTIVGFMR